MTLHPGYAATRISSNLNGSTKQVGWLQASATRNYSAAIGSEHPATIRIDSRPPQHLDLASLRPSPMQSTTSYKPTYWDEFAPVATPASPSFKIATIWDSVNLDFLMTSPVPGEPAIYLYPRRESLRPRYGNTTTERPIFPSGGHGESDEDIVTRNSRRGSKFVRKTRQQGLLFAPTPRV